MSIGNNIRNIRKEKGMTLQQIADIIGCSPQLISQYESGKRQPKLETKKKIADALGCEVSDIDESIIVVPLPKYELTPERLERFKKDAEAEKLIDKKASGENITADDQKKISDYTKRMLNTLNGTENLEYDNSYSYASSAEELDKFQDAKQIELEKKRSNNIHKYKAYTEITPEAIERLKEDAEAREIIKKYESGERILESEYKKVIEYNDRMMARSKLLQDWLEWYKSTCEPLNNEGRKKVAEYAETLAETDKYANSEEWFKGRPTKEEIEKAVTAYLNDDTPDILPQE